ncbi:MAG: lycopene cyclase domain-containing protein [Opitutales bacterium]
MLTSYLQFHWLCLLPVLILSGALVWPEFGNRRSRNALLFIIGAAMIWTTPWDNLLIALNIWDYPETAVLGRIGYVPVEEYLFFILQPLFVGFLLTGVVARWQPAPSRVGKANMFVAGLWVGITLIGALLIAFPKTRYLGLILAWAGPVLAIQTAYGWADIVSLGRRLWPVWVAPTLYFWAADSWALASGIWRIAPETSTGLMLGNLPIEEALFFALTNLMVIQGLVCFHHAVATDWARIRPILQTLRACLPRTRPFRT